MSEEVITHSAEETTQWGREFAARLQAPVVVLLCGELGSGKTTLTKGIVAGLGAASEDEVTSPTFTLVHVYGGASGPPAGTAADEAGQPSQSAAAEHAAKPAQPAAPKQAPKVYHADLYRIQSFNDFETLGLEDVFEKPGVVILEWAERFPLQSPWPQIRVRLAHLQGDRRRLTVDLEPF